MASSLGELGPQDGVLAFEVDERRADAVVLDDELLGELGALLEESAHEGLALHLQLRREVDRRTIAPPTLPSCPYRRDPSMGRSSPSAGRYHTASRRTR